MLLQMAFTVLLCGTSQNLLCEWVVSCSFGMVSAVPVSTLPTPISPLSLTTVRNARDGNC